jgi:hypothetical protein
MNKYIHNYRYDFTCVFSIHHVHKKYTDKNSENL